MHSGSRAILCLEVARLDLRLDQQGGRAPDMRLSKQKTASHPALHPGGLGAVLGRTAYADQRWKLWSQ